VWATDEERATYPEARAWAVQRASSAFSDTRDLSAFGYPFGPVPVTSAPVVEAPPPEVILRADVVEGPTRHVELAVRSRIGAEMLGFALEEDSGTRLRTLNGIDLNGSELLGVDHWGVPESSVVVTLELPADAPIGLHIVEHLLRPEELLGAESFRRPATLAPNIARMSDRAMFRYSVAAFADPRHAIVLPAATGSGPTTPGSAVPDTAAASDTLLVPDTSAASDTLFVPDTSTVPDSRDVPDTAAARDTVAGSMRLP
jgi:hypothetical protein